MRQSESLKPTLLLGWLLAVLLLAACQNTQQGGGAPAVMPPRPTPIVLTPAVVEEAGLLPPLPAIATPQPTATRDPALADWTVLVYVAADGARDAFVAADLNEMEAAGESERVNVLVQVDALGDTGMQRYRIRPDDDPEMVNSELIETLPEDSSGHPGTLAGFLRWGVTTYPANRVALVISGAGGGWRGLAADGQLAGEARSDALSITDLAAGLDTGLRNSGLPRLDLLVLDAPLMGQMDVLRAIQPYAAYAVAAPGLMPGSGLDWQISLAQWLAQPEIEADLLAVQLVNDYGNVATLLDNEALATLTAVDMDQFAYAAGALDVLLDVIIASGGLDAAADARLQTQTLSVGAPGAANISAVDLRHFAGLLLQRSADERVRLAAAQLVDALAAATLAHTAGPGLPFSQGVAIYFPDPRTAVDDAYAAAARTAGWPSFLESVAGATASRPFEARLLGAESASAGPQQPVPAAFELSGLGVADAFWVGTVSVDDGRRRVLLLEDIAPQPGDGAAWPDGIHGGERVWNTHGAYLASGENGGFVAARPLPGDNGRVEVAGRAGPVNGRLETAQLWLDTAVGRSVRMWVAPLPGFVVEAQPQPGDLFELRDIFLDADGRFSVAQGGPLAFDEAGGLQISAAPLPDGDYAFGLVARNGAGEPAVGLRALTIGPEQRRDGVSTYFDLPDGFQFDYPDTWQTPVYSNTLLVSRNISGTTQLTITRFPALDTAVDAQTLAEQALAAFGDVPVVGDEDLTVAGSEAHLSAYGYDTPDGEARTGVLIAFRQADTGYTIDVDGPAADEEATLATARLVAESWQFRAAEFGREAAVWQEAALLGFVVAHPASFPYEPAETWERFVADPDTFIAMRVQPAAAGTADVLAGLVADAGRGVDGFESDTPQPLTLGGGVWQTSEITYRNGRGEPVQGILMVSEVGGSQLLVWAEAPTAAFADLRDRVFLVMAADAVLADG